MSRGDGRVIASSWPEYSFADPPKLDSVAKVGPGVFWVRMPLLFALDHLNLWLIDDGIGWTIVDCGYTTEGARSALLR